ncbi:MAG: hypothetical protein COW01_04395 [Bdellovibrionales bacterium CG12_big_fil_rev_8_21_14_0_65_38_15]|nr:MAG: hypothetical protein COW79_03085 [Bdellovibrionales bacterium CG22_combo_CG10-13_8_21_14_all_38_13]PIQ56507.1 MAG: hypothetical protein COW01_04395 [Bdellovibrionales bacterium CG12_big_fil_rev_8_21_14_0_65_38_15]PIR31455.1 MAG: hypothetical protein COV38_00295 [Bdellovibrionales bacterium CG11_big_fil_rev_8_21_14_0_20_38_13]
MKYLILLFIFVGCTTTEEELQRRNVGEYFTGSGVVQYFLPDLPSWADTVASLSCTREASVRFFDLNKLRQSFGLDYQQGIQFQLSFNIDRALRSSENNQSLIEEERLFYSVSERVQAGIVPFKMPTFKKINLIVVDLAMMDEAKASSLKTLLKSPEFLTAYPVFVSLCFSDMKTRDFLTKINYLGEYSILPMSALSPFNQDGQLQPIPMMNLKEFFGIDKNIRLIEPKGIHVNELTGFDQKKVY